MRFLWIFLTLFLHSVSYAQNSNVIISGTVLSKSGEPLAGATVILLKRADSSFVDFTLSVENGRFNFADIQQSVGGWLLKARSIGYASAFLTILPDTSLEEVRFSLKPVGNQLQEITVSGKLPAKVRGDTILYRGEAYRDSTERKLSELLAKIPGFEVAMSGDVKVNGQAIRTMLLDGDNLLDGNYQVLTNNLSADVVQDVEVIFKYLENPLLAAVFDSDNVAINLLTAPQKRRRLNVSMAGSYGTNKRYDVDVSVIGLYDRLKSVSFLRKGNVGTPLQKMSDKPVPPTDFGIAALIKPGRGRLTALDMPSEPDPTRLNTTGFASTTAHFSPGNNWKIRANLIAPHEDYRLRSLTTYNYVGEEADQVRTLNTVGTQNLQHYGLNILKDSPGKARYELKGLLVVRNGQLKTNFSRGESYQNNVGYQGGGLRGIITKKIGSKSLGILDVVYVREREEVDQVLRDTLTGVLVPTERIRAEEVSQKQLYQPNYLHVGSKILGAIGNGQLIASLGYSSQSTKFGPYNTDSIFLTLNRQDLFLNGEYRYSLNTKTKLRLLAQLGWLQGQGFEELLSRSLYYTLFASLDKEWNILKQARISFFRGRSLPSELKVFPQTRYRSRYLLEEGTTALLNALNLSSQLKAEFTTGNVLPHRIVSIQASINLGEEGLLPDYQIIDNTTVVRWTVGKRSRNTYSLGLRGEYFVGFLSSTAKASIDYQYDVYNSLFLETLGEVENQNIRWRASLRTGLDLPVNFILGIDQTRFTVITSEGDFPSVQTLPYLDLFLSTGGDLSARWSNNWQSVRFGRQTSNSLMADAEVGYKLKGRISRLSLRIGNIFNSASVSNTQAFDFGRITRDSAIRSRYLLLGVEVSW